MSRWRVLIEIDAVQVTKVTLQKLMNSARFHQQSIAIHHNQRFHLPHQHHRPDHH